VFGSTICGTSPERKTAHLANLVKTMGRMGHSTARASLIYQQQVNGRDVEIAEALSQLAKGVAVPDRDTCSLDPQRTRGKPVVTRYRFSTTPTESSSTAPSRSGISLTDQLAPAVQPHTRPRHGQ
jgi:hypothetical protein